MMRYRELLLSPLRTAVRLGRQWTWPAVVILVTMLCLGACQLRETDYRAYCDVPVESWEQHRAVTFPLDSIVLPDGQYRLSITLRTTHDYPFQTLWLLVTTRLQTDSAQWEQTADTLVCNVTDPQGHQLGPGVTRFRYTMPLRSLTVNGPLQGQVQVRHIMRRTLLPGITDVGIIISPER